MVRLLLPTLVLIVATTVAVPLSYGAEECPVADDISPCTCYFDETEQGLVLDCTDVQSEEELANVFQQNFTRKDFFAFTMSSSSSLLKLGDILNGVTFRKIDLQSGPFTIEEVSEEFLLDNADTLFHFHLHNSRLKSDKFPFAVLPRLTKLELLALDISALTDIKPVEGDLVMEFSFHSSSVVELNPGIFDGLPSLEFLYGYNNQISYLKTGTIPIVSSSSVHRFYNNSISVIEPGAFYSAIANSTAPARYWLDLQDNAITELQQSVFGEVLPLVNRFSIKDNPLSCGCDLAWLIGTPLMNKFDTGASCANGTALVDLNPTYYEQNC